MKKVFIYCRVSTANQVDGDGFQRQEETCRAFADKNGWVVLRVFREQQSGSDEWADRKLLSEAMELASSGTGADTIILERADRLSRDLIVSELFLRECKDKKVSVYTADSGEEIVNSNGDPTRTLIRQILAAVAQWDKSVMVRKMQAGRRATAARTGKPCGGPVPNPFGERGGSAQQEMEKMVLRHILNLRFEGWSFARIAKNLRDSRTKVPNPCEKGNVPWQWGDSLVERLFNRWQNRRDKLGYTTEMI